MGRLVPMALLALLFFGIEPAFPKRAAPLAVSPVVYKGITYSAPNRDGRAGYVIATGSHGQQVFRIKVFDVAIDRNLEEDVQWIFIASLKLSGESLLVKDERGRCYAIDLSTRAVKKKLSCGF